MWLDVLKEGLAGWWRSRAAMLGVVAAVASAVAASTAALHMSDAVLRVQLPAVRLDGLVDGFITPRGSSVRYAWSYLLASELERTARRTRFAGVGRFPVRLVIGGQTEYASLETVTAAYPRVTEVQPQYGRWFSEAENAVSLRDDVAVVTDRLCRRVADGPGACVGGTVRLGTRDLRIVGATPAGYRGVFGTADLWIPAVNVELALPPTAIKTLLTSPATQWVSLVGRLAPGESLDSARAELDSRARDFVLRSRLISASASASEWPQFQMLTAREARTEARLLRAAAQMRWATAVLLLGAFANAAFLMLARARTRGGEAAIQHALGRPASHTLAGALIESAATAVVSAAAGIALAAGAIGVFSTGRGRSGAKVGDVLATAAWPAAATGLAVFAVGAFVGWYLVRMRRDAGRLRGEETIGSISVRARAALGVLVAAQVACAVCATLWGALLLASYVRLVEAPLGFEPRGVVAVRVGGSETDRTLVRSVRALLLQAPGVTRAARLSCLPLSRGCYSAAVSPTHGRDGEPSRKKTLTVNRVDDGALEALGVRLVRGRDFSAGEAATGLPVAILSERAAHELFAGREAVGESILVEGLSAQAAVAKVVGIAAEVKYAGITEAARPTAYLPAGDEAGRVWSFVARTDAGRSAASLVRRTLNAGLNGSVHLQAVPFEAIVRAELAPQRRQLGVLAVFAAFALLSAVAGVIAFTRYVVARRLPELGLRSALGAPPGALVRLMARDALTSVGLGVCAGLGLCAAGSRSFSALLFEVAPLDPRVTLVTVCLVAGIGVWAALSAARRAGAVDPSETMRSLTQVGAGHYR